MSFIFLVQQLEDETKRTPEEKPGTPECPDTRHHSMAQIIYAENRVCTVNIALER